MSASNWTFAFILTLGAGFFALNVQRLVSYMRLGVADDRSDHPFERLKNVLTIGIAQTKIFRDPVAGTMHALIFWGFMVLTAGTVEILIQGVFSDFSFALILPRPLYQLYGLSQDGFAALVIAAIAFAFYRRLVLHPRRLEGDKLEHTDALIILSMIGGLMVTLLLTNACQFVLDPASIGPEKIVSRGVASVIGRIDSHPVVLGTVFWWMHALLIITFLNYLPYSKHLHVATSLINVYLSNTSGPGQKGVMRAMDLEADVEQFGASDVEHLSWKNLLDGYSCTEVRPLHRGMSGEPDWKAVEPAEDRDQHATAADGKGAARHRRSDGVSCIPSSCHGEGGDAGADDCHRRARAPPARHVHH
jgi:hypothetical protein